MIFEIEKLNEIYQDAFKKALILAQQYKINNAEQWAKDYAKIELNKQLDLVNLKKEILKTNEILETNISTEPKRDKSERINLGVSLSTGIEDNAFKITSGVGNRANTVLFPSDKDYTYHLECYCHNKGGRCKGKHSNNILDSNTRCETVSIGYEDMKKAFGWRNIPFDADGFPYLTEFYHAFNNGMVSQSYCVKCRRKKPKLTKKTKKTKKKASKLKKSTISIKHAKKKDTRVKGRKNRLRISEITKHTKWKCQSPTYATRQFSCSKTAKGINDILRIFGIQGAKLIEPKDFWTTENGKALKAFRSTITEDRFIHVRCINCEDKRRKSSEWYIKRKNQKQSSPSSNSLIDVLPFDRISELSLPLNKYIGKITQTRRDGLPRISITDKNNSSLNITLDRIKWYKKTTHPLICLCEKPHYPRSSRWRAGKVIATKGILPTLIWKDFFGHGKDYRIPNKHMKITSNGHIIICGDIPLCPQFNTKNLINQNQE